MAEPIEIPASEVRERISDVISQVAYGGARVIISRNGKAQVAVVPLADFERLQQLDQQREARRKRGLELLASIRKAAAEAGLDKLTDEEIEEIVDEARRERRSKAKAAR